MMRLHGKTALITGGTTGIGLAIARTFHAEGARVLVTGANPASIDAARQALDGIATVIRSDAGDVAQIEELFAQVRRDVDGLDILVLNAGITGSAPLGALDEAAFDAMMRINVKGPFFALRAAIPVLRRGASVILTGSISGSVGWAGTATYGASKAAIRSLGRTAAAELVELGVRVNVLSPGPTDSGIIDKSYPAQAAALKDTLAARIPQRRLGSADEIARVALFLASDDSSFMTGEEVVADGGLTRL